MKKTVVVGATTNPGRFAFLATQTLDNYEHEVVPVGIKKGEIRGKRILQIYDRPQIENVDTVTLYIGPKRQPEWYDYILSLKPRRIIFNPGTENEEFEKKAALQNVEVVLGCTLVMLRTGQY